MYKSIFSQFEEVAAKHSERVALEMFRGEEAIRYRYGDVSLYAGRIGSYLADRGIVQGERVAFWGRLSPDWVTCYFGALRGGVVIAPLDIEYDEREVGSILARLACRAVFVSRERLEPLRRALSGSGITVQTLLLDTDEDDGEAIGVGRIFRSTIEPVAPAVVEPEEVATIFFTSGTTGKPKGVVIPHRSMTTTLGGLIRYLRVSPQDKVLAVIPSHHIFASLANILMPLLQGSSAVYPRTVNSQEIIQTMERAGVTVFPAVPQVFYLLHRKIFDQIDRQPLPARTLIRGMLALTQKVRKLTGLNPGPRLFSRVHRIFGGKLRLLVSAASYFDPRIIEDFFALGFTVQQGYALTETFGGGTFTPFDDNHIGSAGKALPGVELRLVEPDDSGVGEIAIGGGCLMQGYLDDPEATAAVLRDGWFYTGDLASRDEAGNIYIRGRRKELIVLSSGKKIYPEEIEQHYAQFPYIRELCVMGLTGEDAYASSERLHAVIVPDFDYMKENRIVNARAIIREGIEEYSAYLPRYKRILSYEIRTEPLPRTTSRKLIRSKITPTVGTGEDGGAALSLHRAQPGDEQLEALESSRQVLAVLRRESRQSGEIHLDMNLELDLGFDSLQRIEVIMQLEKAVGVTLGDDVSNQSLTVRDLLRRISEKVAAGATDGSAPAVAEGWREIIAAADNDDLAARYILEPTIASRIAHFLVLRFIRLLGRIFFRLRINGTGNLRLGRPFLICPNHEGYLDGPLVSASLPYHVVRHLFTLGYTPFFDSGFKNWIARNARVVPVDTDTNLGQAMRISAIGLKASQNLLIFPEGVLSCDGELQIFRKGVGILAHELRLPIVPVSIEGSFEAWSKVGKRVRLFSPITITFGQPILPESTTPPDDDRQTAEAAYLAIASRIRGEIARMLEKSG